MQFTFPASLFVGMAQTDLRSLVEARFIDVFFLSLMTLSLAVLLFCRFVLKWEKPGAALFALVCAFPNMAFMGIPFLAEELGSKSELSVAIGNVISSEVMIPLATFFLESGGTRARGLFGKSLVGVARKPLVVAPLLGVACVLAGLKLPHFLSEGLRILGSATSPVALFALGLMMTRFTFKVSREALAGIALKLLVQPLTAVGFVLALNLRGAEAQEVIMLIAMPAAVIVSMFAEKYDCSKEETVCAVIGGSVLSVVTLVGFTVWAGRF